MKRLDELKESFCKIRHEIENFVKENKDSLIKEIRDQHSLDDTTEVNIYSNDGLVDCFFKKNGRTEHKYYWDGKWQ